jgi:hypothetical protein
VQHIEQAEHNNNQNQMKILDLEWRGHPHLIQGDNTDEDLNIWRFIFGEILTPSYLTRSAMVSAIHEDILRPDGAAKSE